MAFLERPRTPPNSSPGNDFGKVPTVQVSTSSQNSRRSLHAKLESPVLPDSSRGKSPASIHPACNAKASSSSEDGLRPRFHVHMCSTRYPGTGFTHPPRFHGKWVSIISGQPSRGPRNEAGTHTSAGRRSYAQKAVVITACDIILDAMRF